MAFLDDIKRYIRENEFSIAMLDYSRMCFQYGGFANEDCEEFRSMLSKKIREKLPDLDPKMDDVLATLCIERGVHEIVDVYFFGDVAYSKKRNDEPYSRETIINYIGSSRDYEQTYLDYLSQKLTVKNVSKEKMKKLAASLHDISLRYFKDDRFPSTLDWQRVREMDSYPYIEFAISVKEEELARLINQNESFTFRIASKIKGEDNCSLVEVEYIPDAEDVLKVLSVIDEPVKLSSLLEKKFGTKKRELTK